MQARRVLREVPDAVRAVGVEALVADQIDLAASSVAEHLGIPFVTFGCAPSMYLHDSAPPPYFGWPYSRGIVARLRNKAGNAVVNRLASPILDAINSRRKEWGLPPIGGINATFSKLAIISQVPKTFDFAAPSLPHFHQTGPFRFGHDRRVIPFPWEMLDGRPLIYASMGTIRNQEPSLFATIAAACAVFDLQLVISLGGGRLLPQDMQGLAGNPIVVHFAPQSALLARAALTINCAGLNTTLDSISAGVPIVGIPVAEDQPGVAARIKQARVGEVIPVRQLTVARLRNTATRVLADPRYKQAVEALRAHMKVAPGADEAASIIERAVRSQPKLWDSAHI